MISEKKYNYNVNLKYSQSSTDFYTVYMYVQRWKWNALDSNWKYMLIRRTSAALLNREMCVIQK